MRVEKKYLASFTIPFATVYQQGRIEGLFRMDTPMLNFGYDHESSAVMRQKILQEQNMFVGDDDSDEQPLLNGPAGSSRRNSSSRRLGRSRRSSAGSITPAVLDDYFGPLQGIMDGIGEFCYGTLEWIYKLTHSQPWQPNSRDLFFASEMNLHNANTYIHPDTQVIINNYGI